MRLCDALKEKELDLRLLDRHLAEGKLKQADVDKYLKSLPDEEGKYQETNPVEKESR